MSVLGRPVSGRGLAEAAAARRRRTRLRTQGETPGRWAEEV